MQSLSTALDAAANLVSEEGENPEYDRALAELIVDTFGPDLRDIDQSIFDDGMETARPYVANLIRMRRRKPEAAQQWGPWGPDGRAGI